MSLLAIFWSRKQNEVRVKQSDGQQAVAAPTGFDSLGSHEVDSHDELFGKVRELLVDYGGDHINTLVVFEDDDGTLSNPVTVTDGAAGVQTQPDSLSADEAQQAANLNPAIPANPASSQVAKVMNQFAGEVTQTAGKVESENSREDAESADKSGVESTQHLPQDNSGAVGTQETPVAAEKPAVAE